MSVTVTLTGSHRSATPESRRNPFTGQMQAMHVFTLTPDERAAADAVLARHGVAQADDGTLSVTLVNARYPEGFVMDGHRDEDGAIHFFGAASLSTPALALVYELAVAASMAIESDAFGAVTSEAVRARLPDRDLVVVGSAAELGALARGA